MSGCSEYEFERSIYWGKHAKEKRWLYGSKLKQAQRRAAVNRSEHKYSKKYVFISKNMTFGPLGHVLTLLNGPQIHIF